jgi:hypothetical protein
MGYTKLSRGLPVFFASFLNHKYSTMKVVSRTHDEILSHYNNTDDAGKKLIAEMFGGEINLLKITDRVKTFDDACRELSISPASVGFQLQAELEPLFKDVASILAYMKLIIITRALNEGWVPDWSDSDQPKYTVWLEDYQAGVGFSFTGCVDWDSNTAVGSRLCFKSSELAMYAGNQFMAIYNDFFLIK